MGIGDSSYPSAIDTVKDLVEAANRAESTLSAGINSSVTTLDVASTSLFTASGIVVIDDEIIFYDGKNSTQLLNCVRGREGTAAGSHLSGAAVRQEITAASHNVLASAIIALQNQVGLTGLTNGDRGDITVSNNGATWTIDDRAVTFAKMPQISSQVLLGRASAGAGDAEQVSVAGGIEFNGAGFLGISAFTGDVTKTAGGTTLTIADNSVTFAKMQDIAAGNLIGRTGVPGDPEQITITQALDFVGTTARGDILYRDASAWARLPAGTAGRVLQTKGTSANPEWVPAREVLTAARTYFVGFVLGNVGSFTIATPGTVNFNSHGLANAAPVVFTPASGAVLPGGITAGQVYYVSNTDNNANSFRITSSSDGTGAQIAFTGTPSGNVSLHTGNDNNIGYGTNGRTVALLTLQKAIDLAAQVDSAIYDVTLQLCNAIHTHTGTINFKNMGGAGRIIVLGNTTTPLNCIVRHLSGGAGVQISAFFLSTTYDLRGFTLQSNVANFIGLAVQGCGVLLSFMRFSAGTQRYLFTVTSQWGALVDIVNDCTVDNTGTFGTFVAFDLGAFRFFNVSTGIVTVTIANAPSSPTAGLLRLRNLGLILFGGTVIFDGNFAGTPPASPYVVVTGNSVVNGAIQRGLNTIGICTFTIASPGTVNRVAHGLAANQEVRFTTTGTLPTGLAINTSYYVTAADLLADSFRVSATIGGAQINFTTAATGNATLLARQALFINTISTGGQVY